MIDTRASVRRAAPPPI